MFHSRILDTNDRIKKFRVVRIIEYIYLIIFNQNANLANYYTISGIRKKIEDLGTKRTTLMETIQKGKFGNH